MENKNSNDILETVKSDIVGITPEIIEAGFDQFLQDGFLKDLPIVGGAFKVIGIAKKMLDAHYLKNILNFLYQLKDISIEEREKFIDSLKDKKEKKRLDQTLLLYLNRYEDDRKAIMLGNLFKAFIQGHIEQSSFLRLSKSIERAFIDDLIAFKSSTTSKQVSDEIKKHLCDIGYYDERKKSITTNQNYMGKRAGDPPVTVTISEFFITELGLIFLKYV